MSEQTILIKKADGKQEPFDVEKLEHSLRRIKASPEIIQKVTSHILQELEEGTSTDDIYKHAFEILHRFEKSAAIRYSLRRALLELGPSGFPFEKFVAEIFKAKGYSTLTDQMVKGMCVEHEVDVVAWKSDSDELVMCEVKFHNQPGLKSDLKIVLYVKARFEDLEKAGFNYGDKDRKLTEGQLITNTKFTSSALKYAECQSLKIIGWNYPLDGNLHDLVDSAGLHPITSLHNLSMHDKKALLDAGIILCKTIKENPQALRTFNISEAHIESVIEEIDSIALS
jgi:hypothetical protein